MLNRINLERLQTFVVAARASTFAEAARVRGVSISAISQQVRALEGELGHALFERIGRRVRLTEEGRALLEATAQQLAAIDEALEALGSRRRSLEGLVTLGSPRTFGHVWLEPRLPVLLRAAPGLRVALRFDVPSALERKLLEGTLDLAVLARFPEAGGLEARRIAQETFVAVTAPRVPRTPLDEAGARALRWITFAADRPMHDLWWRSAFGRSSNPRVDAVCEVPSLEFMLALVARGAGAAVLPDYLVRSALERGEVTLLPVTVRRPARNDLFVTWRRGAVTTARFEAVRDALLNPVSGAR